MEKERSPYKVLLVDDDVDFLYQEQILLQEMGHEVLACSTMKEARNAVKKGGFHLAVLDLMMEEMDAGLTLAYEIKKQSPKLPVIMVTAISSQAGIDLTSLPGKERDWIFADKIIPKPVRLEQLAQAIKERLQ